MTFFFFFLNLQSGQICMSTDRILVHSSIANAFLEELKKTLHESNTAENEPPTLVSAASKARVEAMISNAIADGAHVVHGAFDKPTASPENQPSVRMAPIILGGIKEHMKIWQEENFASLAACMVVDSDEDAIKVANNSGTGLTASLYTEDLRKGLAIAKKLESGYVMVPAQV